MENEYGILEIEVDENGEIDEKYKDFIVQKCKEAEDEGIWYTQEEADRLLNIMIEETKKCKNTKLNVRKEPI